VYKDQGLVAYSISSSIIGPENEEQLTAFADTMGLTMPVLFDPSPNTYNDYYIEVADAFSPYPRQFIIDKDGNIAYASSNIDIPAMTDVIQALIE